MAIRELKLFLVIVGLASLLAGCNYSIQKNPAPDIPSTENYKASELSFASVYQRVLRNNCVGCHGNGGGISLENYASVKASLSKIHQTVIVDRKMPKTPNSPLTADQLGLLNAWILAGAPESAPGNEPGPTPIPLGPTFESIKYNILETKCLLCHAPGKPTARIPLVTKDDLLNSPLELVIPGNPEESGLMLAVLGINPEKLMPPAKDADGKPTGFTKLSEKEIDAISQWIANGAKD